MRSQQHPGLAAYLARNRIERGGTGGDGSVSLVFDRQYRVSCLPATAGDLLLEARLVELPPDPAVRLARLEALLEHAGQTLEQHAEGIALAPGGHMLVLQRTVPARADSKDFESMLESFVNTLANWRRLAGVL
jgi:hypothetical protein